MRFRDILTTAIQSTFRSKLRTTLTVIAIFIGAFTLTTTSAIGTGVSNYIAAQVGAIGAADVLLVNKAPDGEAIVEDDGPQPYDPDAASGATGGGASGPVALPGAGVGLSPEDVDALRDIDGVLAVDAAGRRLGRLDRVRRQRQIPGEPQHRGRRQPRRSRRR